ncbi:hypothetical protein FACS1894186_2720 [Alphaproteobacteria bacterium]|nr:hypothetical protein FACS1894186_2720 [Alphaproteobacteria bacterium]
MTKHIEAVELKNGKIAFTEASIASLPYAPKGKRYEMRDTATKGLLLRIGERSQIYYLRKKTNTNRLLYIKLGAAEEMTLKDALAALADNQKEIREGRNPNYEKQKLRKDITLKEFYDVVYMPNYGRQYTKPNTQKANDSIFRNLLGGLETIKMLDISKLTIETLHKRIKEEVSHYRANRALALLRHI